MIKSLVLAAKWLLPLLLLFSCASNYKQPIDPNTNYEMDLKLTVNGVKGRGLVNVPFPEDGMLDIKVQAPRGFDLDEITYRYCEKHVTHEREHSFDRLKIPLDPAVFDKQCDFTIRAVDFEKATYSEGLIVIQVPGNNLKADFRCNGVWHKDILGDGGCHAAVGLINHKIRFDRPVKIKGCDIYELHAELNEFEYVVPSDQCVSYFYDDQGEIFRFRIEPYDDKLFRRY